jgi:hypothetical protein
MKYHKLIKNGTICLVVNFLTLSALALPESKFGTHLAPTVPELIRQTNGDMNLLKAKLVQTGVPELDSLWSHREDVFWDSKSSTTSASCDKSKEKCRVLSIFRLPPGTPNSTTSHPVVILPGYTGYRIAFVEYAYDLLTHGFGPVYVPDFVDAGESYKVELAQGQNEPLVKDFIKTGNISTKGLQNMKEHLASLVPASEITLFTQVIGQLPVGLGHIDHFDRYFTDVNWTMNRVVSDFPNTKIFLTSLSMSGLVLVRVLAEQNKQPTWIQHVDRIVLESPVTRLQVTDHFFKHGGALLEFAAASANLVFGPESLSSPDTCMVEFIDKALGNYNPDNVITHSPNRISFTDGLRTWAGFETLGSTTNWGLQELTHQYTFPPFDTLPIFSDALNKRVSGITQVLNQYKIPLTIVMTEGDKLVDTTATVALANDLSNQGLQDLHLCKFKTARHQIDIETDKYREPFMSLLFDQQTNVVKPSYGQEPQNEILNCETLNPALQASQDEKNLDN